MPYGLKRFQKAEALHFITFSCFHRLPLLATLEPKDTFEAALEQIRARHQARIYAYVLRPEHVHMLVNEPPSILLAQLVKALWSFIRGVSWLERGSKHRTVSSLTPDLLSDYYS
jgi:putative transposase